MLNPFKTYKGAKETMKFFNAAKTWFDGKKTYVAAISMAVEPAIKVVKDLQGGMNFFQVMGTPEWTALMGALAAVFIRQAVAKTDVKVEQAAGAATEAAE